MKYLRFFFLIQSLFSFAQNSPVINGVDHHHLAIGQDSLQLRDYVLKAHWEARHRTFVMNTVNEGNLKDDYAMATGAGIGLLTKPLYGFQLGVSGFFIYNLNSSDIQLPDTMTKISNRYEVGLFDIERPENKNDLDRLEELYIKYSISKSSIAIGKININTPFINPQDGRMRPTLEEGIWLNFHESKKIGFNGGWLWAVSPRSTIRWYSISESIGVNPSGVNTEGLKSNYRNNTKSAGLAIANIYWYPTAKIKINFWNTYFENVMNSSMIEFNFIQKKEYGKLVYENLMFIHQRSVNNGGNENPLNSYTGGNHQSNVLSAQIGIKSKQINTSISYTHITGDGRYLSPREWGKEPFYTFLPRERNEGLGNLHAWVARASYEGLSSKFKTGIGYGYYSLPSITNYKWNKYGMPSYHQINYDASYAFSNFFKGMEIKFLLAYKLKSKNESYDLKYIYNKVNMLNANFILDFKI